MLNVDVSNVEFDPDKVKVALVEKGMSQSDFNKILGFKQPNVVNKIIKKNREATATDLLKMSTALNINPSEFCKD